ncbi:hypothetical protein B0H13DRAFT_1921927 [Mycena leptocephala]|nr:hypothetical protein B0H13DRAFT_1921927 [Mycena leptocephala]
MPSSRSPTSYHNSEKDELESLRCPAIFASKPSLKRHQHPQTQGRKDEEARPLVAHASRSPLVVPSPSAPRCDRPRPRLRGVASTTPAPLHPSHESKVLYQRAQEQETDRGSGSGRKETHIQTHPAPLTYQLEVTPHPLAADAQTPSSDGIVENEDGCATRRRGCGGASKKGGHGRTERWAPAYTACGTEIYREALAMSAGIEDGRERRERAVRTQGRTGVEESQVPGRVDGRRAEGIADLRLRGAEALAMGVVNERQGRSKGESEQGCEESAGGKKRPAHAGGGRYSVHSIGQARGSRGAHS